MMLFGKLFPETIFPRKLSAAAEQRVRISRARAEEALVRAHVENALMFVAALQSDLGFERAIDIYMRELGVPDPLASIVATRTLVALGDTLRPPTSAHDDAQDTDDAITTPLPKLRLDDAARRREA